MARGVEEISTRLYRDGANDIRIIMIKSSRYRLEIEWPPEYAYPIVIKGSFGTVDIEAISDDFDEIIAMLNEIWRNSEKEFNEVDGLYVVTDLTQVMKELKEKLRKALKDLLDEIMGSTSVSSGGDVR